MTQESEQLEAQPLESIAAWCKDQSVQLEYMEIGGNKWYVCNHYEAFNLRAYHYRIAKPKKFYRVGKFKNDAPFIVSIDKEEEYWSTQDSFKEWLDERKYYE